MSRREMLASAGLAATGWMMLNNAVGADNPGTNVEDRGASIRITGLKTYLQNNAVDILQPDCAHGGGISQIKKIATLAEAYNTSIAPHSIASFLGVTASFHAAAAVPNFLIHEFYPQGFDGILRKNWEVDKDGYASLPQGPGLGVEVDEVALAKVDPNKQFKWPGAKYPDGSIADY